MTQWILDDIARLRRRSRGGRDGRARIRHRSDGRLRLRHDRGCNPLGFFGMVHVLEGTSVALALLAADRIQSRWACPTRRSATCARTARWTSSTPRISRC